MDLLLIILMMLGGAFLGMAVGLANQVRSPEMIAFLSSFGAIAGVTCAYSLLVLIKSMAKRFQTERRVANHRLELAPKPRPFRSRFARFAHASEDEVLIGDSTYKSTMPFWSAVDQLFRIPPKSAELIRRSLISIRSVLRGERG